MFAEQSNGWTTEEPQLCPRAVASASGPRALGGNLGVNSKIGGERGG